MTQGKKQTATDETTTDATTFVVDADDLVIRKLMPGIVVNLTCHLRGGLRTFKKNTVVEERGDGSVTERWDAGRDYDNKPERDAADAVRQKIRRRIKALGVDTAVGLIVPVVRQTDLAKVLAQCRAEANAWNEESKTTDIVYRYGLYESDSVNKAAIAAVSDQLDDILHEVKGAALADDAEILSHATKADLGEYGTAAKVLAANADERRVIVARVRAKVARAAIKEAQAFSAVLPEETGRHVSNLVTEIRKHAKAWIKASKKDEEEYQHALAAVPTEGITAMQAALVKATKKADSEVEESTAAVAEHGAQFVLGGGITSDISEANAAMAAPISPLIGALAVDVNKDSDE